MLRGNDGVGDDAGGGSVGGTPGGDGFKATYATLRTSASAHTDVPHSLIPSRARNTMGAATSPAGKWVG